MQIWVSLVAPEQSCLSGQALSLSVMKMGFPGGSLVKNPLAKAGDVGSIPGSGKCPGEENDNPLQYSCLGNPTDGGASWTIVHGVTKEFDVT